MLIALIARDKAGALDVRKANRDAHLAYIESTGVVEQAGPLLDDEEQMIGSLLVLNVKDMGVAQDWADNDPYAKAGLFETVDLIPWKRVVGP
ncbi:YciI family protein [uncultured Marivita sp.]|uniref:YciI family protein n=1 Tax=uncultured Marivita sp. TaxID=888080 RepID=UPI0026040F30|nr:YciI family protein [uncultured Marivita sp.]